MSKGINIKYFLDLQHAHIKVRKHVNQNMCDNYFYVASNIKLRLTNRSWELGIVKNLNLLLLRKLLTIEIKFIKFVHICGLMLELPRSQGPLFLTQIEKRLQLDFITLNLGNEHHCHNNNTPVLWCF
jgi:hypothetical protein